MDRNYACGRAASVGQGRARERGLGAGLLGLAALLLTGIAAAQQDPLKSAACGGALAQLEAARTAGGGNVEALRQQAGRICLGSAELPARPGRVLQPPVSVPPPVIVPPAVAGLPAPPAALPPPVPVERAPLPAHCDPGGCWVNDGSRLRHVAPAGPLPGAGCRVQGGVVYCP